MDEKEKELEMVPVRIAIESVVSRNIFKGGPFQPKMFYHLFAVCSVMVDGEVLVEIGYVYLDSGLHAAQKHCPTMVLWV